jgi:NAD(P)-dependent dehydrogenase (short-subunit alcohol dehydrogenase family)
VTDETTISAAAHRILRDHGRLDILINNAAITKDRGRQPEDLPIADLREVLDTNTFGAAATIRQLLPLLRKSDSPLIGNVSSGLGTVSFLTDPDEQLAPYATLLAYNTSKAALNAITIIYARALQADGIRVVALSPGFVATDLNGHTGWDSAAEGGRRIAAQVLGDGDETGVFLSERGGSYPW